MAPRKKNWIQGAVKRPGAFTKKAKAHGMSVQGYAHKVKAGCSGGRGKSSAQERTCRQASLAITFAKMRKGKTGYFKKDYQNPEPRNKRRKAAGRRRARAGGRQMVSRF